MILFLLLLLQSAYQYTPTEKFYGWWEDVVQCSEYNSPREEMNRIEFWHVNAPSFIAEGIPGYVAYAFVRHNEIFVITRYMFNEKIIKHEMLHFILHWYKEGYRGGHPIEFEQCKLSAGDMPT